MPNRLTNVQKQLLSRNIQGLALDIDETLSLTINYLIEGLQKNFGNPENLSISEVIEKYRFTHNVPYWQTKDALDWLDKARKSNKLQENLPLIENSNKLVEKISKIIPISAYITIRSESVIPGTKIWLKKHGFPDVPVIAKPDKLPIEEGSKWKAQVLLSLYPNVVGIIDDNPSIIEFLPSEYKGYIFLYNNLDHPLSGKNIIPCFTWNDVLTKVKDNFNNK